MEEGEAADAPLPDAAAAEIEAAVMKVRGVAGGEVAMMRAASAAEQSENGEANRCKCYRRQSYGVWRCVCVECRSSSDRRCQWSSAGRSFSGGNYS